jgi:hypothetical protein
VYHLSHMCLIKCSLAGKWHGSEENWERGRLSRARVGWPKFLHCSLPSHSSCLTADCERNLKLVLLVLLPAQHCPMHAITRPGHLRPVMRDLTTCKLWLALWCKHAAMGRGKRCGTGGDVCMLQERQEENRMGGDKVWL